MAPFFVGQSRRARPKHHTEGEPTPSSMRTSGAVMPSFAATAATSFTRPMGAGLAARTPLWKRVMRRCIQTKIPRAPSAQAPRNQVLIETVAYQGSGASSGVTAASSSWPIQVSATSSISAEDTAAESSITHAAPKVLPPQAGAA